MKKILLTLSALLLAGTGLSASVRSGKVLTSNDVMENCGVVANVNVDEVSPAAANGSLQFGYAGDVYTAYSFNGIKKNVSVYVAMELDSIALKNLKGNNITQITMYSGVGVNGQTNYDRNINIFISTDLSKEPEYTQAVTASGIGFRENNFKLDTPFEITGETPIYIGYNFVCSANSKYVVCSDGIPYSGNSMLLGIDSKGEYPESFVNQSESAGSACIFATVTGENLPEVFALPKGIVTPFMTKLDSKPVYDVTVRNNGSTKIENITFEVIANNEETSYVDFTPKVTSGRVLTYSFDGAPYVAEGQKVVSIAVAKVNGIANPYSTVYMAGNTVAAENTVARKMVVEEGTGTWCGYCPAGIVLMEHLAETWPDDVYRIAIHTGDEMTLSNSFVNTYYGWLQNYASGVPAATMNRCEDLAPTGNNVIALADSYVEAKKAVGTYANAFLETMQYDAVTKKATFYTYTDFTVNDAGRHYVEVAVVEDGIGPYNQTNYYANNALGAMGGWEKKGSSVSTIYDDVARGLSSYGGELITSDVVNKGEVYFRYVNLDLRYVKNENFRAIMMVTNEANEIVNACQLELTKSGVEGIASDKNIPIITTSKGAIEVSGAENVAIYSLTGSKIANGSVSGIPAGVYVVKADNVTMKVVVR